MAHVVAHVGRHVGRRMGMMRGVSLGVKVMMLLGRRVAWWRLNTCACVRGSSGATATAGRQLDAKIGEVVRMRGHAVQERVHHPDLGEILFFFFFFRFRSVEKRDHVSPNGVARSQNRIPLESYAQTKAHK